MAKKKAFSGLAASVTANNTGTSLSEKTLEDFMNKAYNQMAINAAPLNQQLGQQIGTGVNSIPNNNNWSVPYYPASPQPVPGQLGGGYYPQQPTINSSPTFLGGSSFFCVDCPEPKPGMQQSLAMFMFKGDSLCKKCFDGRRKRKNELELILEKSLA